MTNTLASILESVGTEMVEEICKKHNIDPNEYKVKVIIARKGYDKPVDFRMGLKEDEWIV